MSYFLYTSSFYYKESNYLLNAKNRTLLSFLLFEIFEFETMATNYALPVRVLTQTQTQTQRDSDSEFNSKHFGIEIFFFKKFLSQKFKKKKKKILEVSNFLDINFF